MSNKKISELPEAPYKEWAIEAQRRGAALTEGEINEPNSLFIIGLCDMIRELAERLDALEEASRGNHESRS